MMRHGSAGEDADGAATSSGGASAAAGGGDGGGGSSSSAAGGSSSSSSSSSAAAAAAAAPTWRSLGVCDVLCEAITALKWARPTRIQAESLPASLSGRDVIGLAETGSGKTAAFALPILQALLAEPARLFALVLAPTRELAFQIAEQFEALGSGIGIKTAVIVGGVDMMSQAIALARKPHVVIGTPGRVVDHLQNTKGFSLRTVRYLVLDEADRMLSLDFEEAINVILASLPREGRRTFLFSATMTTKVAKLQRASLVDPVRVEVSEKFQTVQTLVQQYLFLPAKYKEAYLAYVLNEFSGNTAIVFVATCAYAQRATAMMVNLGFSAVCLHGQMPQAKRLAALARFKAGGKSILVATDVAARGLDIPAVDVVLNFDVPSNGKDYIHRVGRTARAGRSGRAITFVTQYDIELYQRIETLLGKKLEAFPAVEEAAMLLHPRVLEASRLAALEARDAEEEGGDGGGGGGRGKKRRAGGGGGGGVEEGEGEGDDEHVSAAAAAVRDSAKRRRALGRHVKERGGGGRGGRSGKW